MAWVRLDHTGGQSEDSVLDPRKDPHCVESATEFSAPPVTCNTWFACQGDRRDDERGGSQLPLQQAVDDADVADNTTGMSDIRIAAKHIDCKEVTNDYRISRTEDFCAVNTIANCSNSKSHMKPVRYPAGKSDDAEDNEDKLCIALLEESVSSIAVVIEKKTPSIVEPLISIDENEVINEDCQPPPMTGERSTLSDGQPCITLSDGQPRITLSDGQPRSTLSDGQPRSICDELRQLSRVNSLVEQGSLATIRGSQNRVTEDGKRSQSTESVSERRGTHIARLIQSKSVSLMGEKPIYPNVPFSPYGSPSSSPGLRRRPLKECRRVSIETNGEYTQLNQYKLKQAIGQVRYVLQVL